jgi:hypothetical protein
MAAIWMNTEGLWSQLQIETWLKSGTSILGEVEKS